MPSFGACERRNHSGAAGGVYLNARQREGHWHVDGAVCAAIEGYPRWAAEEWAKVARDRGHGAALHAAYRARGTALLEHLQGSFTIAILDLAKGEALLAIDRVGLGALCYSTSGTDRSGVVFGSTTDCVAAFPGQRATVSAQSLYEFLYFVDRVPAPATIYAEQKKLAPGEYLSVRNGEVNVGRYWQMRYTEGDGRDVAVLGAEMFGHMRTAVSRIVEGETPQRTGAFLSGGLDSSTVVGLLSEQNGAHTRAFTVAFDIGEYDESQFARAAVQRFDVNHSECRVTPEDILALIPKLAEIYDEPFANHSTVPTYHCARHARDQGIEVMLAGDGGDEIFAGNTRYLEDGVFDHYRRIPAPMRSAVIEPFAALADRLRWFPLFRKVANYVEIGRMSIPERMNRGNLFSRIDADLVFAPDVLAAIDLRGPLRLAEEIFEASPSPSAVKKMMHVDLRITLADGDLRKVNRMCELAGVRVRYPFLDDDVVAFSGRVPDRLLVEGGQLRAFFKKAVTGFLPDKIINKSKHGFGLPFIEYADRCGPLLEFIRDSVTALKRRRIFREDYLDRMIACHRGEANGMYRGDIWDLMMIELWHRQHVDNRAARVVSNGDGRSKEAVGII